MTATCFVLVQTIQGFLVDFLIWVLQMLTTRSSCMSVTRQSLFTILQVPYLEVHTRIPTIKPRRWFLCVSPSESVRGGSQPSMTVGMPIVLWIPFNFLSAPFCSQESLGLHHFAGSSSHSVPESARIMLRRASCTWVKAQHKRPYSLTLETGTILISIGGWRAKTCIYSTLYLTASYAHQYLVSLETDQAWSGRYRPFL